MQKKADLKNALGVNTSNFAKKNDLASLKLEFDRFYIDKLEATSIDLSKLSDVVKNDVVKETKYDKLVKKVNAIQTSDTSNLVKRNDYDTKISEVEKKVLDHDHAKYFFTHDFNEISTSKISS